MNESVPAAGQPPGAEFDFRFTKWAKVSVFADVVVSLICAVFFVVLASYVAFADVDRDAVIWLGVGVLCYGAIIYFSRVFFPVKYRHLLRSGYVVSDTGITVHANGGQRSIGWEDFTTADYLPLIPIFRLSAAGLPEPIVLFMIGDVYPSEANDKRKRATSLILERLDSRLRIRWVPW